MNTIEVLSLAIKYIKSTGKTEEVKKIIELLKKEKIKTHRKEYYNKNKESYIKAVQLGAKKRKKKKEEEEARMVLEACNDRENIIEYIKESNPDIAYSIKEQEDYNDYEVESIWH